MLGKILKLFVGDKSKKDLKEINPIINQIHSYQDEMNKLSNDELRQKTEIFKKLIKDSISEININVNKLKNEINDTNDFDLKEDLFLQIDKLNQDAYNITEETLNNILPQAFAVVKETAKRFVEKGHEVNLITTLQNQENGVHNKKWTMTNESGINVYWFPIEYSNKLNFYYRVLAFFKFAFQKCKDIKNTLLEVSC